MGEVILIDYLPFYDVLVGISAPKISEKIKNNCHPEPVEGKVFFVLIIKRSSTSSD